MESVFACVLAEAHGDGIVDGDDLGFSCADQELANGGVRPICADQEAACRGRSVFELAVMVLPSGE